jgi:N-acetyl-alpha-D-muramate 1-phosphate uridylyltransferase
MSDSVAGVVLAAGLGRRLRPLSLVRPKALCPVGNVPLVDLALERLAPVGGDVAVNVHHHREAMEAHLDGRVHLSVEEGEPLGTAGALGHLRGWLDGRAAVVVNVDGWCPASVAPLLEGWDEERVRVLVAGSSRLLPSSLVAGALLPWPVVEQLEPVPSGLWEVCWRDAEAAGQLDVLPLDGPFVDCGTPGRYLEANLAASGGASVVEPGAVVEGRVVESVVWRDGVVHPDEVLTGAIRYAGEKTVLARGR